VRVGRFRTPHARAGGEDLKRVRAEIGCLAAEHFALLTGWRLQNEVLSLTWDVVDWEGHTIRIAQAGTKSGEARLFPFGAAPELLATEYAHEIWKLYEAGRLQPESPLTGRFEHDRTEVDVAGVLDLIEDERLLAEERQRRLEEAAAGV